MRPGDVSSEDPGGKTVRRVVGPLHHLVFGTERQHGHDRPEYLLLHDRHVLAALGEDRRLDEEAGGERRVGGTPAADDEASTGSLSLLDVTEHLLHVLTGDEGT